MKTNRMARIFSVIQWLVASGQLPVTNLSVVGETEMVSSSVSESICRRVSEKPNTGHWSLTTSRALERTFLSKRVARKRGALRALGDLDAHGGRVRGGDAGWPQHGVLGEDFVVNLGDEIILPVGFAAPDLPELDGIDGHVFFLNFGVDSRVSGVMGGVNSPEGYRGA